MQEDVISYFFVGATVKISIAQLPDSVSFIPVIDLIGEDATSKKTVYSTAQINVFFNSAREALLFIVPRMSALGFPLWFPLNYQLGEFDSYIMNDRNEQVREKITLTEQELSLLLGENNEITGTIH